MEEILHQLRLVVHPFIYNYFLHPRWLAGFFLQQYHHLRHPEDLQIMGFLHLKPEG